MRKGEKGGGGAETDSRDCYRERQRDRDRDKERERDRQREKERQRDRDRERERQTDTQTDRQTETEIPNISFDPHPLQSLSSFLTQNSSKLKQVYVPPRSVLA